MRWLLLVLRGLLAYESLVRLWLPPLVIGHHHSRVPLRHSVFLIAHDAYLLISISKCAAYSKDRIVRDVIRQDNKVPVLVVETQGYTVHQIMNNIWTCLMVGGTSILRGFLR